jgi:hypothetical protein
VYDVIVGGVASKILAVPGVPSGPVVLNPVPVCAIYQLAEERPSHTEDFRSIEAGRLTSPAGHGFTFA